MKKNVLRVILSLRKVGQTEAVRSFLSLPQRLQVSIGALAVLFLSAAFLPASAANVILVPGTLINSTGWAQQGTLSLIDAIDDGATTNTANFIDTGTNGNGGEVINVEMANQANVASATQVVVHVHARSATLGSSADTISVQVSVGGTALGTSTHTMTTTYTTYTATYTGTWTQAQVDNMQVQITRNVLGSGPGSSRDDDVEIANVFVDMTYTQSSSYELSGYRWFANANSTTPGAALAAQNTSPQLSNTQARLQMLVHSSGQLTDSTRFNLRFAEKTSGTCSSYQDIVTGIISSTPATPTAATTAQDATAQGSWSDAANVSVSDNGYATGTMPLNGGSTSSTNFLIATGFGLNVPVNTPITGVTVESEAYRNAGGSPASLNAYLVVGGVRQSTNRNVVLEDAEQYRSHGGSSDTWGTTLTSTNVNSSDFGVALKASSKPTAFSGDTAYVDNVRLTVHYEGGSTSAVMFFNNSSPTHRATAVNGGVTHGSDTVVTATYNEANEIYVRNAQTINDGQDALFDFSLDFTNAAPGATYCIRLEPVSATMTYAMTAEVVAPVPSYAQANYRFYASSPSAAPGTPLAAQDTSATIEQETPFRLRQRLAVEGTTMASGNQNFKLQYKEKTSTCIPTDTGYDDVSPTVQSVTSIAGSASNIVPQGGGYYAWSTPTNVTVDDGIYSEVIEPLSGSNRYSDYLVSGSHSFSIPATATIKGIEVIADRATLGDQVYESGTRLIKGGVLNESSTNRATAGRPFQNENGNWGGATDLWGTSWTPAEINNPGFGAGISVQIPSGFDTATASIDHISIRVYYTVASAEAPIAYHNEGGVVGGAAIGSDVNDPLNGARATVHQSFLETDPFTNAVNVPVGSDGLWDFSLIGTEFANNKTYCLRIVKSDGTLLDSYSQVPEIQIGASNGSGPAALPDLMRGGQSVRNGVKNPFIF